VWRIKKAARNSLKRLLSRRFVIERLRFFFVRGYMRSGTNWVGNLLNKHPRISCAGEFHLENLTREAERLLYGTPPETWGVLRRMRGRDAVVHEFHTMVKRWIVAGNIHNNGVHLSTLWYGDRTPQPLEPLTLPEADHIVVVRDGRDVLVSETLHFLRMADVGGYPFEDHPRMVDKRSTFLSLPNHFEQSPEELLDDEGWVRSRAQMWSGTVQGDDVAIGRILAGELAGRVHRVRFEDLHHDVEGERRRMYAFLGARPDDADPLDGLTVAGFEGDTRRKAHYRSGKTGQWRRFFTSDTMSWYLDEAAATLARNGYGVD
jgi:hypothetical protein